MGVDFLLFDHLGSRQVAVQGFDQKFALEPIALGVHFVADRPQHLRRPDRQEHQQQQDEGHAQLDGQAQLVQGIRRGGHFHFLLGRLEIQARAAFLAVHHRQPVHFAALAAAHHQDVVVLVRSYFAVCPAWHRSWPVRLLFPPLAWA
jgi:hypothetical protein